ncbi:MAG TPA: DUF4258 domain-containing protein [Nitrospiraceae bacterium]|jgi:hypothetical protein|nr:DUF4258 domain-containing protein [Nitrospiraceae bacterium]
MITLDEIRQCLVAGTFEFSRHAFKRVVERNISERDIREAGRHASIIENYPDDKYAPSCLLLGFTDAGRPLHIQVSYIESDMLKIITIYQPDPGEWYDYSRRR